MMLTTMMMMMSLSDKLFGFGEILVPRKISTYLRLAAAAWFGERASERAYVGYVVCTSGVPFVDWFQLHKNHALFVCLLLFPHNQTLLLTT
jgi:hypothetical protein